MTDGNFLLWAHTLLLWTLATYVARDPADDDTPSAARRWRMTVLLRAAIPAAVVAYLSGSASLASLLLVSAVLLPAARSRIPARYCAEIEVGANAVVIALSLLIIRGSNLDVDRAVFALPVPENRIAASCVIAALALFTVHGGTYIVRGILKKSGAVPMLPAGEGAKGIDVKEFNRGRLIGALERVLLFAVVIAGSFEALGFIVAAKGLVRSREFEVSRDMTEYFLIGSLASVLVALATGWLAQLLIRSYW